MRWRNSLVRVGELMARAVVSCTFHGVLHHRLLHATPQQLTSASVRYAADFYKLVKKGKVPPHDVIVTNPPYRYVRGCLGVQIAARMLASHMSMRGQTCRARLSKT